MSRSLFYAPYVEKGEFVRKDIRVMDFLQAYFSDGEWFQDLILDHRHVKLLTAMVAVTDEGEYLLEAIEEYGSIIVSVRN